MSLRDVTFSIEDGSLGNSKDQGQGVHVKIGASPVASTVPLLITNTMKPAQIKEKLGLSPLADACLDSIENGAGKVYCIPIVPESGGTVGAVKHTGSGTGKVSAAGDANNAYDIIIQITGSGALNAAEKKN